MPFKAPSAPKCPKCSRSVFAAEEKMAGGYKWHKSCFKCDTCNKFLDSTTCAEHEMKLYCKTCHGRNYGPKGYGFGSGAGILSTDSNSLVDPLNLNLKNGKSGSGPLAPEGSGCPRCGGYVYHADTVFSKNQAWHVSCFKCSTCNKSLDSRNACDGPDKDIYCNGCYRKKYGIQGYGFGHSSGPALLSGSLSMASETLVKGLDTTSIQAKSGEGCPRCGGQVFHAEQMFSKNKTYHKKCFSCHSCKRPLDSVLCCDGPDEDIYCKSCYAKSFGAQGYGYGGGAGTLLCGSGSTNGGSTKSITDTSVIQGSGRDACPRCGGQVFHAEKMLSKVNAFHKGCFCCLECRKPLDSTSCCDAPNEEIYCKQCYGKNFGPKGYGFGGTGSVPALMASGTCTQESKCRIQTDFLPKELPKPAQDGSGCPRCGYSVFEAEKLIAAQKSWHKRCFTCASCGRHLDSTTVNDGPDGNIYCHNDYSVKFGLRGYGFGAGAGVLQTSGEPGQSFKAESAFMLP